MDVVVIFNGLGNQMSQYAFYLQKKSINKSTYYISLCSDHNGLELDTVFNIKFKKSFTQRLLYILFRILLTNKLMFFFGPIQRLLAFFNCKIVKENFDYNFKPKYLSPSKGISFFYGGWPSEKYFLPVENEIVSTYKFNKPDDIINIDHEHAIINSNSVSMHVRRGDYLDKNNFNLFGQVCSKEYFEQAIKLVENAITAPHFYVFSNDIEWVKNTLKMENVTYVINNGGKKSWKDMYLMSLCKHNIISNSSFSWWGAWLNKNANKLVVSPSRYLNNDKSTDFYPETWTKLSEY